MFLYFCALLSIFLLSGLGVLKHFGSRSSIQFGFSICCDWSFVHIMRLDLFTALILMNNRDMWMSCIIVFGIRFRGLFAVVRVIFVYLSLSSCASAMSCLRSCNFGLQLRGLPWGWRKDSLGLCPEPLKSEMPSATRTTCVRGKPWILGHLILFLVLLMLDVFIIHDAAAGKATNTTAKIPLKNRRLLPHEPQNLLKLKDRIVLHIGIWSFLGSQVV